VGPTTSPTGSPPTADPLAELTVTPGKVTKVIDPLTGGSGYWLLYLPKDYSPNRKWPVIFCYHGLSVPPTCYPFDTATGQKGYIQGNCMFNRL
jgi:hypothetical protein